MTEQQHGQPPAPGQPSVNRRSFLKAVPVGALMVAAGRAQAAEAPAAVAAPVAPAASGYHETEHIRSYYRTAAYW